MRLLLLVSGLFALLLVACSDGSSADKTATATPNAVITSPAESTPSGGDGVTPETGTPAPPAADPFSSLDSYRYELGVSGDGAVSITIKGVVKAPDSYSLDFYLSGSDTPVSSMVIIGTQAWEKDIVSGQWQSLDVADAKSRVTGLMPADFWGDFPFDDVVSVSSDQGQETVNNVKAQHYQISDASGETLSRLAQILGSDQAGQPETFSMDLWLAADGNWPVKATISATFPPGSDITQATITWELTDANSSGISIQPPA